MKKRIIRVIAVALAVISVFFTVGCGEEQSAASSVPSSVAVTPSETVAYDLTRYGNLPSNINNGGRAVFIDGSIIYYDTESTKQIRVFDLAEGSHKTLVEDGGMYLNVYGGELFFVSMSGKGICSVSTDGGTPVVLSQTDATRLFVYEGTVYYSDDSGVYTMAVDGSDVNKLYSGSTNGICVWEGELYVIDATEKICLLGNDGSVAYVGDRRAGSMVVNNGWIYFVDIDNGRGVAKMRTDGSDYALLTPYLSDEISISGSGDILYINREAARHLTRVSPDGEGYGAVSQDYAYSVSVVGSYTLYIDMNSQQLRLLENGKKSPQDFLYM